MGGAIVGGELLTGGSALVGAGLGAGFDTAGQGYKILMGNQDEYRYAQTFIGGATGALFFPLAGGPLRNTALGGVVGGSNTALTNLWYGGGGCECG